MEDIPVATGECLIPLKMKAFLDLKSRKENGEQIDSDDIKKHKNDVFRIAQIVVPDSRCSVPEKIREDMRRFIETVRGELPELRQLDIRGFTVEEILKAVYCSKKLSFFKMIWNRTLRWGTEWRFR